MLRIHFFFYFSTFNYGRYYRQRRHSLLQNAHTYRTTTKIAARLQCYNINNVFIIKTGRQSEEEKKQNEKFRIEKQERAMHSNNTQGKSRFDPWKHAVAEFSVHLCVDGFSVRHFCSFFSLFPSLFLCFLLFCSRFFIFSNFLLEIFFIFDKIVYKRSIGIRANTQTHTLFLPLWKIESFDKQPSQTHAIHSQIDTKCY